MVTTEQSEVVAQRILSATNDTPIQETIRVLSAAIERTVVIQKADNGSGYGPLITGGTLMYFETYPDSQAIILNLAGQKQAILYSDRAWTLEVLGE